MPDEDVEFVGSNTSIIVDHSSDIVIEGIAFGRSTYGLLVINSTGCSILNNEIAGFSKSGIYLNNSTTNYILSNHISCDYETDGITLRNSSDNILEDNFVKFSNYLVVSKDKSCINKIKPMLTET